LHFPRPNLEVIGLTAVFGNVHVDLAATNALRLLEIAGRTHIPVARGAANSLVGDYGDPPAFIHGDDGQGNVHLPPPAGKPLDQSSAQLLSSKIMAAPRRDHPRSHWPMTNIALALRLEPRIAQNVKQIVLMGGNALVPGNSTPVAEANIKDDPEAADVVFGADWPVTMVGLDVTTKASVSEDQLQAYARSSSPMAQHIARITPFYLEFSRRVTESAACSFTTQPPSPTFCCQMLSPPNRGLFAWRLKV